MEFTLYYLCQAINNKYDNNKNLKQVKFKVKKHLNNKVPNFHIMMVNTSRTI